MSDTIKITGIKGFGYHGVLPHERENGQDFEVDVEIGTNFSNAVASDDLERTLNYALIADIVFAEITGPPVNLIETLADQIAQKIIQLPLVESVAVTVHKPYAPIEVPFKDVSVTRRLP